MEPADAIKYNWVAAEVLRTPSILSTKTNIGTTDIVVSDPPDWLIVHVDSQKRICNSFDEWSVSFYECLFTLVGLQLPLSEFEVAILKHLKVSPSQIHPGSQTFMKVFQFWAKHMSWKPSLGLFFNLFYVVHLPK